MASRVRFARHERVSKGDSEDKKKEIKQINSTHYSILQMQWLGALRGVSYARRGVKGGGI